MISIRRHLSCWIDHKRFSDWVEEQLDKALSKCVGLMIENLRKDEAIRKLTAQLNASQSFITTHTITGDLLADFVSNEIPRRRAEAIERNRIEHENRVGAAAAAAAYQADFNHLSDEGYDEIDSQSSYRSSTFQ